jgi:hypothetical protein
MKLGLRIERDGKPIAVLELGPGEHAVGRAPDCAVVLPDRAVSSRHALLRVGEKSAELIDQESLNGIFLDGRKVGRLAIDREMTAEIGGYRLHFHPKAKARPAPSLPALNLRPAVLLVLAVLALGTLAAVWIPGRAATDEARQREGLRRGALLVRFLAEQNVSALRAKHLDQVRVTPVSAEEGVLQAFVTDPYGKILAPPKDMGRGLDNPRALRAAKEPGVSLWTEPSGETILTCPIRDGETLLGLAYLAFDPDRAVPGPDPAAGLAVGLVCAALLWGLCGAVILRLTLRPARRLAEDMGVALKSGSGSLGFRPPCREYAELALAAERLLALIPAAGPAGPDLQAARAPQQQAQPAQPAQPPRPDAAGSGPPTAAGLPGAAMPDARPNEPDGSDGTGGDAAWCLLSLDGYRLVDWSPAFAAHLAAPDLAPPVHLLTALADPALLSAVAEAVEDPDPKAARQVQGRSLAAVKRPGAAPGTVRVAITETT